MSNIKITSYTGSERNLIIPTTIDGVKVTELCALSGKSFTKIQGNTIEYLPDSAF